MIIICEGPDASGKSTLAAMLSQHLGWRIEHSPGPTKSEYEFNNRVSRFLSFDKVICDRHPVVSEAVYGGVRGHVMTHPLLAARYYQQEKFIVYCPGFAGAHIAKRHDTTEHLDMIEKNKHRIAVHYQTWALQHADFIYRGRGAELLLKAMEIYK